MAKKNASKEGIRLAEEGDWAQLLTCLLAKPAIAQQRDHYGMLPLHWACTENDVPINVLLALIEAYPDAAMAKNDAQMLPLHVAIRSNVGPSALSILCAASPDSIWTKLPDGLRPLAMATMSGLDQESLGVLQKAEEQYRWTHPEVQDDDDDEAQYEETKRDLLRQSQLMRDSLRDSQLFNSIVLDHKHSCESSPMGIEEVEEESSSTELADVTKRTSSASSASSARHSSGGCHVCHKSFSVFRKKYVCCSCHVCICKHHIMGRRHGSESSKAVLCADCVAKDQPQAEPTPERRLQHQRSSTFLSSPDAATTPPKPRNYSSETPPPSLRRRSASSRGEMEAMDKDILMRRIIGARGSGSDTASCTGSEQEPSDVSALSLQVRLLEARNASLELRVFEQEKQHNEAMLLLTQTMTRLAELEMKMHQSSSNSFSSVENGVLDFHNPFTEHFSSS
ncbi:hypothetical protein SPRG_03834 [Saprolegnia parasitica CBS 223.65]|uniref:Uncharacterized protein n=1 Tax=Saprolegnia parasitica (strain CBS 223.65) TaxID=695850 RepID=A0A067CXI9_SAPPC|nr:hypothetical protein SPRG_03834 [Saprolegnia parasitica CBS 223.65]KDO31216.1 hypothetical protein SPRG_03834 [Saprolegnia parasitica CBS 223.65]|eukprot:XP_012197821.1 hypothetical protein SPRG_03834 [Saprolegnia parasitica CBS 223.65]